MSAVKLDRDGNVVEHIPFNAVQMSPTFLQQIQEAARKGWESGKQRKEDS